jgi:hypothetical protein
MDIYGKCLSHDSRTLLHIPVVPIASVSLDGRANGRANLEEPPSPVKAGWVVMFLICSCWRVSCAGLEVAAGAYDVRISHIHGSLSG